MGLPLHQLPTRSAGAPENMAVDFMLLQRYPETDYIRFRHYDWHRPAFTFGYSQKYADVRAQLPADEPLELCRRATGGGVVDHRNDWTYALVIPRGHPAEDLRASDSYRLVHEALRDALNAVGGNAVLEERGAGEPPSGDLPSVCFTRAERFDVVHAVSRLKIAGAAQKRNKRGLLLQGSILHAAVSAPLDWDRFETRFVEFLGRGLNAEVLEHPWPDWSEDELAALVEQYSSAEWNQFR